MKSAHEQDAASVYLRVLQPKELSTNFVALKVTKKL
jgi:hypothetical protein